MSDLKKGDVLVCINQDAYFQNGDKIAITKGKYYIIQRIDYPSKLIFSGGLFIIKCDDGKLATFQNNDKNFLTINDYRKKKIENNFL